MNNLTLSEVKQIKMIISQAKSLEQTVDEILFRAEKNDMQHTQYASFKNMALIYNDLAFQAKKVMKFGSFYTMNTDDMKSWGDTLWPYTKSILENVLLSTRMLIKTLESNIDFIDEQVDNFENFIRTKLRSTVFSTPSKEIEVQNHIERLFIGRGLQKGIEYDRETGKFNYSGREYIPYFILPKLRMCIEVKLLKDTSRKSKVIEEINADITAYKKQYEKVLFVIYDIGVIRDEVEFCRDIQSNNGIKVVIVKH